MLDAQVRERALSLKERLASCDVCPRRCGVNRAGGEKGVCRVGAEIPVAHVGLHFGEEPPISGTRGSGTIFFAYCNLRCVYCQNFQISQQADELPIRTLSPDELAAQMLDLQARGAHNVNLVSPSHVIAQAAEGLCIARERGLSIPIVYNTNGYDAVETLRCLEGLVDIYLPDVKYSSDEMARAYSGVDGYVAANRAAIAEMSRQVGRLRFDREGIAVSGLLVRHLVLPAGCAGSADSLAFLASLGRKTYVSLMAQYSPQYRASAIPPLDRRITPEEYDAALAEVMDLGMSNVFVQEVESSETFLPDFRRTRPFGT